MTYIYKAKLTENYNNLSFYKVVNKRTNIPSNAVIFATGVKSSIIIPIKI